MVCFFCPGGTCNALASKWALLNLASSRQLLPSWISSKLTWGGCGAASLKLTKTPMDRHTLKNVSGGTGDYSATVGREYWMCAFLCFSCQIWKLRNSPWASCAAQTSLKWPGAWSTLWQLASHARVMVQAGTPSFSGFLCPTYLHLHQTLSSECFFLHRRVTETKPVPHYNHCRCEIVWVTDIFVCVCVCMAKAMPENILWQYNWIKVSRLCYKIGNLFIIHVSAAAI